MILHSVVVRTFVCALCVNKHGACDAKYEMLLHGRTPLLGVVTNPSTHVTCCCCSVGEVTGLRRLDLGQACAGKRGGRVGFSPDFTLHTFRLRACSLLLFSWWRSFPRTSSSGEAPLLHTTMACCFLREETSTEPKNTTLVNAWPTRCRSPQSADETLGVFFVGINRAYRLTNEI